MDRLYRWLKLWLGNLLLLALFASGCGSTPAYAQDEHYPLLDFAHRVQLSASSGYLWFTQTGDANPNWKGIDVGGAATYSIHPRLAIYGAYAHGFPFDSDDGHANFLRAAGNLKIYPGPDEGYGKTSVWLGAGLLWQGKHDVRAWRGMEAHITGSYMLDQARRWAAYTSYSHAFALESGQDDFDFFKLGLTTRLYGR
jgi:hypothetical protein